MNAIPRNASRSEVLESFRSVAQCLAWSALPSAALLLAGSAQAQSAGCLQFRDTLAARVDPSIHGFTLEPVPANAPVPPGAKVFGTCDGGAYKLLFRRGGNTRPAPSGASEPAAAVASKSAAPTPTPAPPPAPKPTPGQAPVPAPVPAPVVAATAPPPVAPPPAAPAPQPEKPPLARAKEEVEPVRTIDRVEATPAAAPPGKAPVVDSTPEQSQTGSPWRWMWVLLAVPLVAWLWAWVAHRRAYDEAGLPRGPKITL